MLSFSVFLLVLIMICTMKLNRLFLVFVPDLCLAFSSCSSGSRKADDDIPLPASVDVPHVAEGDYADMSRPNLAFTADKIVCNYPVESHVYVVDRRSGQTNVFEAPSRYTANKAEPCRSRTDYTQWERYRVENPHFYELMYLPASGRTPAHGRPDVRCFKEADGSVVGKTFLPYLVRP